MCGVLCALPMLLGKRKTLEEANPIIQQLEEERKKKRKDELRKKEEKSVMFGVKSLTSLLDSIESGHEYGRRGTRAVNKDLAKWGNQVVISPAQNSATRRLATSPSGMREEYRQQNMEQGRRIRSIVSNLGIEVPRKRQPSQVDAPKPTPSPLEITGDNRRLNAAAPDVARAIDSFPEGVESDSSGSPMSLPVLRAVDSTQRKLIRQMPRLSHFELDIVSKIEKKFLATEFQNDAKLQTNKATLYNNLAASPSARAFKHGKRHGGAKRRRKSKTLDDSRKQAVTRSLPSLVLPEKEVANWLDGEGSPLKQQQSPSSLTPQRSRSRRENARRQSPAVLRRRLEDAKRRERHTNTTLSMRIHTLERTLPAELVMKHRGSQGVASRIVQIVEDALTRVLRKKFQIAIAQWKRVHAVLQGEYETRCAVTIQRYVRGFLARRVAQAMRAQRDVYLAQQAALQRKLTRKRNTSATKIIATFRCFVQRKRYLSAIEYHRAAIKIQKQFRVFRTRRGILVTIVGRRRRLEAAINIERVCRGHMGRRYGAMLRKIRRVDRHREWLIERAARFELLFQREGAATQIQMWWAAVVMKLKARAYVRLVKYKSALLIERVYRGHRGRLIARELRHLRNLKRKKMDRAATVIQRNVRVFLGHRRMQKLLRQKRIALKKRTEENRKKRADRSVLGVNVNNMNRKTRWLRNKTLNFVNGDRETQAALVIQRAYRGMRARKHLLKQQLLHLKQMKHRKQRNLEVYYATKIQACWRGRMQRRKIFRLRTRSATVIQNAFRAYIARTAFKKMLSEQNALETAAAISLQRIWRGRRQRHKFLSELVTVRIQLPCTILCQRLWRGYNGRKQFKSFLQQYRRRSESQLLGAVQYSQLFVAMKNYEVMSRLQGRLGEYWFDARERVASRKSRRRSAAGMDGKEKSAKRRGRSPSRSPSPPGNRARRSNSPDGVQSASSYEVEHTFLAFCNPMKTMPLNTANKELNRELSGGGMFKRMCRATGLAELLPQSELDMVFAKHKERDSKGLDLKTFCGFLVEIANKVLQPHDGTDELTYVCPTMIRLAHPGSGLARFKTPHLKGQQEAKDEIDAFQALPRWLQGYRNNAAKVLRILTEHFLNAEPMREVGAAALNRRVTNILSRFAVRIQNRVRGIYGRGLAADAKQQRQQLAELKRQNNAATMIQAKIFRAILGRRKSQRAAAALYVQYVPFDDDITKRSWYNSRTNRSFNFFPPLMTQFIANKRKKKAKGGATLSSPYKRRQCRTSRLPKLECMYRVPCVSCDNDAHLFCGTCSEVFCKDHGDAMHSRGNRKMKHSMVDIPKCAECLQWTRPEPYHLPQVATIEMKGGNYDGIQLCDECWHGIVKDQEDGGVIHRLVAACAQCKLYAARWECMECGGELYCNDCYVEAHRSGKRQLHRSTPLTYYPQSMLRHDRHEREQLKTKEALDAKMGALRDKNTALVRNRSAKTIQRAFRFFSAQTMYKSKRRRIGRARHAKFLQRKKDDKVRRSCTYKIKRFVRAHPELPSDEFSIPKTLWRRALLSLSVVGTSSVSMSSMFEKGAKVEICNKRHAFFRAQGIIMTPPETKKKPFHIFLSSASKSITVILKDIRIPQGVQERIQRRCAYTTMLARERNTDWFGLPVKPKFPTLKRSRYKLSRKIRRVSAKKEMKRYDDMAKQNPDMDYNERLAAESRLYVAPLKTTSWNAWEAERVHAQELGNWEWLNDLATGNRYWLNVETNERREFKPRIFLTRKDILWYYTALQIRETYRQYTIQDYEKVECDWFIAKKVQKVLSEEEVKRQEAAKWKRGHDDASDRPFWYRTVIIRDVPGAAQMDEEDFPTREEKVWEMPLELMDPEERTKKIIERQKEAQQKAADDALREENELKQAARMRELERKKAKRGSKGGRRR